MKFGDFRRYFRQGGTCAYNVTLSQADLESGINKFCKRVTLSRWIAMDSDGSIDGFAVTLALTLHGVTMGVADILQLLEQPNGSYAFWTKWGRVGESKKPLAGHKGQVRFNLILIGF